MPWIVTDTDVCAGIVRFEASLTSCAPVSVVDVPATSTTVSITLAPISTACSLPLALGHENEIDSSATSFAPLLVIENVMFLPENVGVLDARSHTGGGLQYTDGSVSAAPRIFAVP
jgi:hypothetical protein